MGRPLVRIYKFHFPGDIIDMGNQAEKEKIREFCYELALALRRITGRVIENDCQELAEDLGEKAPQAAVEDSRKSSGLETSSKKD
jgi:hypothetical protein